MKYPIGKMIKKFRLKAGFSQKELASQIGVSSARLSNWELGINRPDVDMLIKLCTVLNASANALLELNKCDASDDVKLTSESLAVAKAYQNAIPEVQAAARALLSIQ